MKMIALLSVFVTVTGYCENYYTGYTTVANGYTWHYYDYYDGSGIEIDGDDVGGDVCVWHPAFYDSKSIGWPKGEFSLPTYLDGRLVVSIGPNAFNTDESYNSKMLGGITSIVIPAGVKNILETFRECHNLSSFKVSSDNQNYTCVDGVLYDKAVTTIIAIPCTKKILQIPSTVSNVGGLCNEYYYSGGNMDAIVVDSLNPNFTSVDGVLYDKNVTRVICVPGRKTSVTVPGSVKNIGRGHYGFSYNENLKSITITEGLETIDERAFFGCVSLEVVRLPSTVTRIGQRAFTGCDKLTSVIAPMFPRKVYEGQYEVDFYDEYGYWSDSEIHVTPVVNPIISTGTVCLAKGAFEGNDMTSVMLPESLQRIEQDSFKGCSSLTEIDIPLGVTNVGSSAFAGCTGLGKVNISNIDAWSRITFENASSNPLLNCGKMYVDGEEITSVVLSDEIDKIGNYQFCGWDALKTISFFSSVGSIGVAAFEGCAGLSKITIPSSVGHIGVSAFFGCSDLDALDFEGAPPSGLSSAGINQNAFIRYNVVYEEEWLPVIEECGFTNASPYVLQKPEGGPYTETVAGIEWTFMVTNGESVIKRAPNTISGDVTIPSVLGGRTVVGIAPNAIHSCHNLNSVTIPSSVTEIGASVFYMCPNLSDVTFEGDMVESVGKTAFDGCHWDLIIHVPSTWTGRGKTLNGLAVERAGESETVNNVNLTVTNVVVHYILNSVQPNIAVPVSSDTGFVTAITEVNSSGVVSVPSEWKDNYATFTTKFGADFGKALMKKSGKKDGAGNDMLVWQDFVAGTDPTDENDTFTASITVVDGVPVVSYTPELTAEQKALRTYKTFGKKQLQDTEWTDITNLDGEGKKPYNFFKVTVEMK